MNDWELYFARKSRRRARRRLKMRLIKAGVLALLFGSLATAVYMKAIGY